MKPCQEHDFEYKMKDTCTGERVCKKCQTVEAVEDHSFEIESRDMYDVEHDMNNLVCNKCGFRTFEAFKVL